MAWYKRGKKYYFKGKYLNEDGSTQGYNRLATNAKSKAEALEMERKFLLMVREVDESTSFTNFEDLANEYLLQDKDVKESTKISKREIQKIINNEIGDKRINLIRTSTLQKFIDKLERKYSVEYVKKIYYNMNSVFEYALRKEYLMRNPLKHVVRTTNRDAIKGEKIFWSPAQFEQFIKYVDESVFYVLFNFLYFMGCRRGEALAMSWRDINFEKNIVIINKSLTFKTTPPSITSPKTKNSYRNISMPKKLYDIMMEFKTSQTQLYGFCEERYIFGYDKHIAAETLRSRLKKGILRTNNDIDITNKKNNTHVPHIPTITIHSLRHSHASYLINNKSDTFTDFDISKRLGDTVQTLHSTYAHWFKESEQNIMELMNKDFK